MAVWQTTFRLLPIASLETELGLIPLSLDENEYEAHHWWQDRALVSRLKASLDFLPNVQAWTPAIEAWGREDSNYMYFFHDQDGKVLSVQIRIDLYDPKSFTRHIVSIAQRENLAFLTEDGRVVPARWDRINKELENSPAAAFIRDPEGFLKDR